LLSDDAIVMFFGFVPDYLASEHWRLN
jgi:hypothetical protein